MLTCVASHPAGWPMAVTVPLYKYSVLYRLMANWSMPVGVVLWYCRRVLTADGVRAPLSPVAVQDTGRKRLISRVYAVLSRL